MTERTPIEQAKLRLRRIEGQVRGIQGMLHKMAAYDDEACDRLLTQLLAVRAAIERVGLLIMEIHLERCVLADLPADSQRLRDLREALKLWTRLTSPTGQARSATRRG